ncbi:MAG: peptidase S41 [Ignavibacteriae bacterium HGW-Ignavibacteriae-2]|jgi:tricorn protease|nr:MAG: peptidase S41 [Ignavibacteriae bacterium HGW-Ignavibacteriae-2]
MKKLFFSSLIFFLFSINLLAQIDARMLRYPDVSETQITFVYAGDIWIVDKTGGTALKLSSPKGEEMFPRFSPDGKQIAFSGNYDGNLDIYTIPTVGGIPKRITSHSFGDRLLDWTPDGKSLLYASSMYSGRQRYSQFFKVPVSGGLFEQLPVPYGEFGSLSNDGTWLAYTKLSRVFRTWKRYRGGMAADITLFNMKTYASENITNNAANDEIPMWSGDKIYYMSDNGAENRNNIWVYDLATKSNKQLTSFSDYDIHFPSIGPKEIVFEAGGILYLMDLATNKTREVKINVVTDQLALTPHAVKVADLIENINPSPDGKRVVVEARGELFSLPAEFGPIYNLTDSPGSAERFPAWSPDGKSIAYWSDKSGEYQLYQISTLDNKEKKLTSFKTGFKYNLYWSPDSKKLAFIDQTMTIYYYDLDAEKLFTVDKGLYMYEGSLRNFSVSWSSDSKWIAYSRDLVSQKQAIFIYDTKEHNAKQVTSGFYSDMSPSFDPEGKYLFFLTNRNLSPIYSDLDNTFVYPNATQLAAASLRGDVPSPLAPKNDTVEIKKDEKEKKDDKDSDKDKKKDDKKDEKKIESVKIDVDGFESRIVILPPDAGNMNNVQAVAGKVLYHRFPNSGSSDKQKPVKYYDLTERKEETIIDDADSYTATADGKKLLVSKSKNASIIDIKPGQKLEKQLRTNEMEMTVDPKSEWKQIFTDVWRFERDYFYDPNMHGVDWNKMKTHYGNLIEYAATRTDVNFIIGELIGELNASHTYRGGGDNESPERKNVGYLGINWSIENNMYKIDKIIEDAPWDVESRSPLAMPNIKANVGDYILAVNGAALNVAEDPYIAFQGLAGKTVELTLKDAKADTLKKVLVDLMDSEDRLRHLAWIEINRKRVDEATGGKIGYIYVPSTGVDGQTELIRQFTAQLDKEGLIIDERFNSGGQIPDRFVEMLNRKPLAFWAVRDGHTWQWPPAAVFGPKVMLINGWSGSGGDAFPDYFRKYNLGPLVGTRTWGGLIGISGAPSLIDGGSVTVPTFRMYDPDGDWFREGHGVDPDIEVDDDPTQLAKGVDPQLEKAIDVVLKALKDNPPARAKQPPYEKR